MDKRLALAMLKDIQRAIDANRNAAKQILDRNQQIESMAKQLAAMIQSPEVTLDLTKKTDD